MRPETARIRWRRPARRPGRRARAQPGTELTEAAAFRTRLRDADARFAATILCIVPPLTAHYRRHPHTPPPYPLLASSRLRWVNDVPSFGCLSGGPTPIPTARSSLPTASNKSLIGCRRTYFGETAHSDGTSPRQPIDGPSTTSTVWDRNPMSTI